MRRKISYTVFFFFIGVCGIAQNINAPYSTYGIGDIDTRYYDRSSGMGYTSMALPSKSGFLLIKNPASLAGLDRSFLQVDLSLTGKTVTYAGNAISATDNTSRDMAIKRFSLSTKLNNTWASNITVSPFSYVNYLYTGTKYIEGSVKTYTAQYEGDGGLYNVSWNNAFSLGKHFAVGVRSSFIFGSINQTETLQSESLIETIESKTKTSYNNFRFEYGALYSGNISKNWKIQLGGKFTTQTNLNAERTLTVLKDDIAIEEDKVLSIGQFRLPASYSAGIALVHKERSTFAIDYAFENWSASKTGGNAWSLVNSRRISAGWQFNNTTESYGQRFVKSFFQAGIYSGQSYLQVRNTPITEYGATLGYGGILSGALAFNLSLEAGTRGTTSNGLIKENFIQFTLGLSYREFLFSKGRKYR